MQKISVGNRDKIRDTIRKRNPSKLKKIADTYDLDNINLHYDKITVSYILPYYKAEQIDRFIERLDAENAWDSLSKVTQYLPKKHKYYIEHTYNEFTDVGVILRDCNEFIHSDVEVSHCNFIINFDFDPYEFLHQGLLPNMHYFNTHYKQMFLVAVKDDIPDEVMQFFYGNNPYNYLKKRRWWTMRTLKDIQDEVSSTLSLSLMFSYPQMLYTKSRRPKTTMDLFRTPLSLTGKVKGRYLSVNGKKYHIYDENTVELPLAIPVVRYSKSVDVGLYFGDKPEQPICGTFYYYEPESSTYLICNDDILIARTKTSAVQLLLQNSDNDKLENLYLDILTRKDIRDYESGLLHEDMKYTPSEAITELRYISTYLAYDIEDYPMYLGSSSLTRNDSISKGMYASEDDFDQPLCLESHRQGYDLVILTHMIGAFQIVTEVLDTRERYISFSSLVYT